MMECRTERTAVEAVVAGQWPHGCDEMLRAHVHGCEACTEAVRLALCFREDCGAAMQDARVPPSGVVWWRAAVRARMDAAHIAARPITWMHGVVVASLLGILSAVLAFAWPTLRGATSRAWAYAAGATDPSAEQLTRSVLSMTWDNVPLALAAAGCLLLMTLIAISLAGLAERPD